MPECQVYGCINKAEEGASKREKIFQITQMARHSMRNASCSLNRFTLGHIVFLER